MRIPLAMLALLAAGCGQNSVDAAATSVAPGYSPSGQGSPVVNSAPAGSNVNVPMNLNGLKSVGQPMSGKVNPDHGKPGHRCDIAVGALLPLETAPAQTAASPQPTAPVATPAQASATEQVTVPGLNPPHGKPGHRCDIAVGAPLHSEPTTTTTRTPVVTPTDNPAVKPGTNPPHGKPGHRCDIAVGAPLDSKRLTPTTPTPVASDSSVN